MKCATCGHDDQSALPGARCSSCGSALGELVERGRSARELRFSQGRFDPLWFLVSLGITALLTTAIVLGLPNLVRVFDFEGYAGMMVAIPVWFASGLLVGLISPGRTFAEPALAALLIALPTALLLFRGQTVKAMPAFMYLLFAALGVLFALVGSYVGERLQAEPDAD